ncbi:PEP-CTERM sorting domain-containing protein [Phycisphaerales bacterium AB-hyl4]|uniref:PEP-CTERM sorting domain-containing protein n=1 Tax=Natronomicrosphaera hydrolytica TaxID=3242702 RepID=A0ABV4U5R3_9BACT
MRKLLTALAVTGMAVPAIADPMWDFNDQQEPWIDNSTFWEWDSNAGIVNGENIHRHIVGTFHVPLNATFTQDDDFFATFDLRVSAPSSWIGAFQVGRVGFFNQNTWGDEFSNFLGVHAAARPNTDVSIRFADDDGTGNAFSFVNSPSGTWFSYEVVYASGEGDNNAGLLTLNRYAQGDLGGTPDVSQSYSLLAGQEFAINAFGLASGHDSTATSNGFGMALDNVSVIPEPASIVLLGLGAACAIRRRNRQSIA